MPRAPVSQPGQRRNANPIDQFGRRWFTQLEIITAESTGGWIAAGWSDPLATPGHLIRMARTPEGMSDLGRCVIDMQRWIRERQDDEEAWFRQLYENAKNSYKRIDPADVAKLEHDKFIVDLTGPKPWPSVKILERAAQGYKPFLGQAPLSQQDRIDLGKLSLEDMRTGTGLAEAINDAAPESMVADDMLPPDNYREFIGWAFRTGAAKKGDLKAAAALWHDHAKQLTTA